jgi:hypothetical protein
MLELVSQADPERLIFRCPSCLETGTSSPSFAQDGYFWDGSQKPGKWIRHKCTGAAPAEETAPKPRAPRRSAE